MPIPFLLIGVGAVSALVGIGSVAQAGDDQKEAKETNELAQSIVDRATSEINVMRKHSGDAITWLGEQKIYILDNGIKPFISSFEKLHNVELSNSTGLDELKKFRLDKQSMGELKEMQGMASTVASGVVSGAALGAVTAFGAYGAAMTFGAASTGTAIATLSGAAATNATLAFFGGGSLAAGGLGMAGGSAVLGGLVAGPALAIMGLVIGAQASTNKDNAYSNLAKAKEYDEEMKLAKSLCKGIRMRADMFTRMILKLGAIFDPLVYSLNQIIATSGTDYSKFSPEQKATVAACMSMAGAIKAILDTPILNEDGSLAPGALETYQSVKKALGTANV